MNFLKRLQKAWRVLLGKDTPKLPRPPYEGPRRLYVLVRKDLPPGYQIAQAIHAKDEFTHTFPEAEKSWRDESNTIVVLAADQEEVVRWVDEMTERGIKCCWFEEPDMLDKYGHPQVTASAFDAQPEVAEAFKHMKLALR